MPLFKTINNFTHTQLEQIRCKNRSWKGKPEINRKRLTRICMHLEIVNNDENTTIDNERQG